MNKYIKALVILIVIILMIIGGCFIALKYPLILAGIGTLFFLLIIYGIILYEIE